MLAAGSIRDWGALASEYPPFTQPDLGAWCGVRRGDADDGSRGKLMAKRRRRGRVKRRRPNLILLAMLALLVAGFVTRRVLAPRAMRFLTHRSAPATERPVVGERQESPDSGSAENLTDSDRRALDTIVRDKNR